jgi:hypothetical protein
MRNDEKKIFSFFFLKNEKKMKKGLNDLSTIGAVTMQNNGVNVMINRFSNFFPLFGKKWHLFEQQCFDDVVLLNK